MKKGFLTILLGAICLASSAQDIHYAQFDKAPMLINPGLAGIGKGFNRFNLNYRTQWGALNKAYSTMAVSYDMPILSANMGQKDSYFGVGVDFFSDKSGDAKIVANHIGLTFSGILKAGDKSLLTLGINTAFEQRSYNSIGAISWDNQWDGTQYDPNLGSGETFGNESYSYLDFSTGVAWKYSEKNAGVSAYDKLSATVGLAYFHFNRPSGSFYNGDDERQYGKIVAHAQATIGLSDNYMTLSPSAYYSHQGPYDNIIVGGIFKYLFRSDTKYTGFLGEKAIGIGIHVRGKDALIPTFIFEMGGIELGINYDYTISTLQKANNGAGGFELSLRWQDTYGVLFKQGDKHVINL